MSEWMILFKGIRARLFDSKVSSWPNFPCDPKFIHNTYYMLRLFVEHMESRLGPSPRLTQFNFYEIELYFPIENNQYQYQSTLTLFCMQNVFAIKLFR